MWQCSTLADGDTIVELRGFGEVKTVSFLLVGGGNSNLTTCNIFQMGWFNHHLLVVSHFENNCQVIQDVTLTNPRSLVFLPLEGVTFFTIPKKVTKNCQVLVNLRELQRKYYYFCKNSCFSGIVAPLNGDEQHRYLPGTRGFSTFMIVFGRL